MMRWYVSRNGETVGPVDESQIAGWIRGGMVDAFVQAETGGQWLALQQSPFATLLPAAHTQHGRELRVNLITTGLALAVLFGLGIWAVDSCKASSARLHAECLAKYASDSDAQRLWTRDQYCPR
jgi:hypothetical protein